MVLRVLLGFFIGIGCEGFWEEGKGLMGFGFGGLRCVGDLGGFDSNATQPTHFGYFGLGFFLRWLRRERERERERELGFLFFGV